MPQAVLLAPRLERLELVLGFLESRQSSDSLLVISRLSATSNSVTAEYYSAGSVLLCHRRQATPPSGREKRLYEYAGCCGQLGSVTEPPGFRDARQAVHINIFYSNHFEQSKAGMGVAPAACSGSAVGASVMP